MPGVIVGAAIKTTKGANSAVLRTFNAWVKNKKDALEESSNNQCETSLVAQAKDTKS